MCFRRSSGTPLPSALCPLPSAPVPVVDPPLAVWQFADLFALRWLKVSCPGASILASILLSQLIKLSQQKRLAAAAFKNALA